MEWTRRLLEPEVMLFGIPIAAIALGAIAVIVGAIVKILKMLIIHRERMAKIAHGIDPDYPPSLGDAGPR
jgi:hypothetical protein